MDYLVRGQASIARPGRLVSSFEILTSHLLLQDIVFNFRNQFEDAYFCKKSKLSLIQTETFIEMHSTRQFVIQLYYFFR
ncbi:hypothetical protein GCM10007972_15570 [Iodidimonas muriae]|uniref:Uncharacterized protein n=1 Tax=Iodidimonas muriae TaxID=261467 RepID=A0ABQ2LF37_9PROT|nr:hypothetical protein JCM17843_14930 [Kordiimonadales bacterium JCM 17843]GGO11628.1 hypothetical protein GCM10007972_15570 [Iodidimonas muriae]